MKANFDCDMESFKFVCRSSLCNSFIPFVFLFCGCVVSGLQLLSRPLAVAHARLGDYLTALFLYFILRVKIIVYTILLDI